MAGILVQGLIKGAPKLLPFIKSTTKATQVLAKNATKVAPKVAASTQKSTTTAQPLFNPMILKASGLENLPTVTGKSTLTARISSPFAKFHKGVANPESLKLTNPSNLADAQKYAQRLANSSVSSPETYNFLVKSGVSPQQARSIIKEVFNW